MDNGNKIMVRCRWCNHYNPDVAHANYCEMCGKPLKKREYYYPEVEQARFMMLKRKKERDNMDWRDLV
jgi:rRNA maturation endonuclease Nob1